MDPEVYLAQKGSRESSFVTRGTACVDNFSARHHSTIASRHDNKTLEMGTVNFTKVGASRESYGQTTEQQQRSHELSYSQMKYKTVSQKQPRIKTVADLPQYHHADQVRTSHSSTTHPCGTESQTTSQAVQTPPGAPLLISRYIQPQRPP